jgi:hypothetical protein
MNLGKIFHIKALTSFTAHHLLDLETEAASDDCRVPNQGERLF